MKRRRPTPDAIADGQILMVLTYSSCPLGAKKKSGRMVFGDGQDVLADQVVNLHALFFGVALQDRGKLGLLGFGDEARQLLLDASALGRFLTTLGTSGEPTGQPGSRLVHGDSLTYFALLLNRSFQVEPSESIMKEIARRCHVG